MIFFNRHSRHRLVDALDAVAHGELVNELLAGRIEVDLPGIVALRLWQSHHPAVLLAQAVEEILVQTGVLHVIRCHLLLALDLDADVQPNRPRHRAFVRPLLQIVPDVHLAAERPDLDDGLSEKIVALPRQLLPQLRLQVIILVPHSNLDSIGRIVALAANRDLWFLETLLYMILARFTLCS